MVRACSNKHECRQHKIYDRRQGGRDMISDCNSDLGGVGGESNGPPSQLTLSLSVSKILLLTRWPAILAGHPHGKPHAENCAEGPARTLPGHHEPYCMYPGTRPQPQCPRHVLIVVMHGAPCDHSPVSEPERTALPPRKDPHESDALPRSRSDARSLRENDLPNLHNVC